MGHSFSRNHVHLVFRTKDRRNSIAKGMQPQMWSYVAGICKNYEMAAVAIGGTENHAHILFHLSSKIVLAGAIAKRKFIKMDG